MKRPVRWTVAVATVAVVAVGVVWWQQSGAEQGRPDAAPTPGAAQVERTTPSPTARPGSPRMPCDDSRAFSPKTVTVPGVTRGAPVVTPPRDANGVPGVPPLTGDGKSVFAWDREQGTRPGDPAGNVLLNAHTWPDGSALGNRLLAGLHRGDRIVLRGTGARLCYRVTERVEVRAEQGLARYYDTDGPPKLAIVVCSGRRLGPGQWEKRTVWFAAPSV